VILAGHSPSFPPPHATPLWQSASKPAFLYQLGHVFGAFYLADVDGHSLADRRLTSIAVISLIYHNAVPRTQPWHSVLPGATLLRRCGRFATRSVFGWYLQRYATTAS